MYANRQGQLLCSHSALTGLLAEKLVVSFFPNQPAWAESARLAGFSHDLGKLDPDFIAFLGKGEVTDEQQSDGTHIEPQGSEGAPFTFDEYPRHNEVSWLLLKLYTNPREVVAKTCNPFVWPSAAYAAYWHHARPLRSPESQQAFSTLKGLHARLSSWVDDAGPALQALWHRIHEKAALAPLFEFEGTPAPATSEHAPSFKEEYATADALRVQGAAYRKTVHLEAMNSAIRAAVVTADRLVSSLSPQNLELALESWRQTGDTSRFPTLDAPDMLAVVRQQVEAMVERFEQLHPQGARNAEQDRASSALAQKMMAVLQGPAGCGKTKILLQQLAKSSARRAFILVPRSAIGQGLFQELTEEYGITDGVELCTGDIKLMSSRDGTTQPTPENKALTGNLVITTIDQVCGAVLSHRRIDFIFELMQSSVIFDEFHELFDIPGISVMFMELLTLKQKSACATSTTTLVSATPNPYFLAQLGLAASRVVRVRSFNEKPVHLQLLGFGDLKEHPFEAPAWAGDIVISNTASRAQRGSLAALSENKPVICFHSKFTPEHKRQVLTRVMSVFGKQGQAEESRQEMLMSGPIVQASLNISAPRVHMDASTAENWLQRSGRCNRFGEFDHAELLTYALRVDGELTVLKRELQTLGQAERAEVWLDFLLRTNAQGRAWTFNELYDAYELFHHEDATKKAYEKDFERILKAAHAVFANNTFDPVQYPNPPKPKKGARTLATSSLRGLSQYILPWHVELNDDGLVRRQDWLYSDSSSEDQLLVAEADLFRFAGDSERAKLLDYVKGSLGFATSPYLARLPKALSNAKKNKRALKTSVQWQSYARRRAMPLVVSMPGAPKSEEFGLVYLTKNGVSLGLMPMKHAHVWIP